MDKATPTEDVVFHPRILKIYHYSLLHGQWFSHIYIRIIVTYLSTQYSIAMHTKVKESIMFRYRTQLSIYLQQLQFLLHFVLRILPLSATPPSTLMALYAFCVNDSLVYTAYSNY